MGSLFSSKTEAPAPPPPVDYVNTRDEIGGTQSTYVTNPDGTKTLVTTRLPLTPEQQEYQDSLDRIATESLAWIEKLSTNYDRKAIPWLDQYLTDYETTQVQGADKALADRTDQEESAMARYGVEDSTAGIKAREQRGRDYSDSRAQITRDMSSIEQQARANELGNANNLYSLATGRLDTQLGQLMASSQNGMNFQMNDAGLQQNRNLAIYQGGMQQQQINNQSKAANFGNLTSLAALATYGLGKQGFNVFGRK